MKHIFIVLLLPLIWFHDLLFKSKGNLLEFHFNYDSFFCYIKMVCKQTVGDDLLIASYIFFLARYFYICDERQVAPVRGILLEEIRNREGNYPDYEMTQRISTAVFQTLNGKERSAAGSLFPMGPPVLYKEEDRTTRILSRYSFSVFKRDGNLSATFHISLGPDIVLLPVTVGIMYEFVMEKLKNKAARERLKEAAIQLLELQMLEDCRSLRSLVEVPREILTKSNINVHFPEQHG